MKTSTTVAAIGICFCSALFAGRVLGEPEPRSVDYYLDLLAESVREGLREQGVLDESGELTEKYYRIIDGKNKKRLNKEGIRVYSKVRLAAHEKLFRVWNYQQHIARGEYVYALYFSIAGFEDLEWQVVRWEKDSWKAQETIDKKELEAVRRNSPGEKVDASGKGYTPLFWNWDEGPKNRENVRIFVENDYLVLERSGLYHSLYDLKSQETLINKTSPWHGWREDGGEDACELNEWITIHLNEPIEKKLKEPRE